MEKGLLVLLRTAALLCLRTLFRTCLFPIGRAKISSLVCVQCVGGFTQHMDS